MLNRRHILAVLLLLPLLIAGCRIETINYFPPKNAHVRVMNIVPNAPNKIDIAVDGGVKWPGVTYEGTPPVTEYMDFSNETHTFSATVVGASTPLTQANFNLAGEAFYTLIVFGAIDSPQFFLLSDDTATPTSGKFLLRIANAAAGSPGFDLYITPVNAAL